MARAGRIREWRGAGGQPGSGPSDRDGGRAPRRRLHGCTDPGLAGGLEALEQDRGRLPSAPPPIQRAPCMGKRGGARTSQLRAPRTQKKGGGGGPRDKGRGRPSTSRICSARGKLRGARGRAGLSEDPEGRSRREGGWAPEQHRRKWEDRETRGARASAQKAALRPDLGSPGHPKGSHLKLKMRLDPSARLCLQNPRLQRLVAGNVCGPKKGSGPGVGLS